MFYSAHSVVESVTEVAFLLEEFEEVDKASTLTNHESVATDRQIDSLGQILNPYFLSLHIGRQDILPTENLLLQLSTL